MSGEGPESIPTSADPRSKRALKKRAVTPLSSQARDVEALFAKPAQEIALPAPGASRKRDLPPPPEIVTNVQGSSAGAGSGEFHVYKASRRREYERLRRMDEEVALERAAEDFEKGREERERRDEDKTRKNREKREKAKARKAKGKDSSNNNNNGNGNNNNKDGGGGNNGNANKFPATKGVKARLDVSRRDETENTADGEAPTRRDAAAVEEDAKGIVIEDD
ncbi:hypothetical protein AAE478_005490 [Parahypoxylon ruwenzoriense]